MKISQRRIPSFVLLGLCSVSLVSFTSCSEDQQNALNAAIESKIAELELSDCSETSDIGYVDESETATDEESETSALDECIADIVEDFDFDEDGEVSGDTEVSALNTHIEERQAAKTARWEEEGLTAEEGRARDKANRKSMRKIAKEACLESYDADSDGKISKDELKTCADALKADRKKARADLKCANDDNGECAPLDADTLKSIMAERAAKRDTFVGGFKGDDGEISTEKLKTAGKELETKNKTAREDRAVRESENQEKIKNGKSKRKERGSPRPK